MPVILSGLGSALPLLRDVGVLAVYFFVVFGIIGVTLWSGQLRRRCADNITGLVSMAEQPCSIDPAWGFQCPLGSTCTDGFENPVYGIISFDSLPAAFLSIFQTLTTEGWSTIMFDAMDATNGFACIYFVAVVVGSLVSVVSSAIAAKAEEWDASHKLANKRVVPSIAVGAGGADDAGSSVGKDDDDTKSIASVESGMSGASLEERFDAKLSSSALNIGAAANLRGSALALETTQHMWIRFRKFLAHLVCHPWAEKYMLAVTTVAAIELAAQVKDATAQWTNALSIINQVCTWIFAVEMVAKITGVGPRNYVRSIWNIMDFVFTVFGLLDLYVLVGSYGFSALRVLRAFRILRIGKFSPELTRLMKVVGRSLPLLRPLLALWIILMITFSVTGIQIFSNYLNFTDGLPRYHFDSFGWAMLSVVDMFTTENWNNIEVSVVRAKGIGAALFCVLIVIVGAYIVSQMLLGIIISAFQDELADEMKKRAKAKAPALGIQAVNRLQTLLASRKAAKAREARIAPEASTVFGSPTKDFTRPKIEQQDSGIPLTERIAVVDENFNGNYRARFRSGDDELSLRNTPGVLTEDAGGMKIVPKDAETISERSQASEPLIANSTSQYDRMTSMGSIYTSQSSIMSTATTVMAANVEKDIPWWIPYWVHDLVINWEINPMRRAVARMVHHRYWQFAFLAIIVASCVTLALDEPKLDSNSSLAHVLHVTDIVFAIVFSFELFMTGIADGLVFGPTAYLKDPLNWVDVLLIVISIICLAPFAAQLKVIRILRLVRVLRLLKMHEGLRIVTLAIWKTIPALYSAGIPYSLFVFIFSILGLSVYVGTGWQCNDVTVSGKADCIGNYTVPSTAVGAPRRWQKYRLSYDNFFESLLSVVVITMQEGTVGVPEGYMDDAGIDVQPHRDTNPFNALFWVVTEILGNWLFLSIITGLVFDNLRRNTEILKGIQHLSDGQKQAISFLNILLVHQPTRQPVRPTSQFHANVQKFVLSSKTLETATFTVILLDVARMATVFYGEPTWLAQTRYALEVIFVLYYTLESFVIIYALGFRPYFSNGWNGLNFAIVIFAILDLAANFWPAGASLMAILRLFRVLRTIKILRYFKALKALTMAIAFNIAQLVNVLAIQFLVVFVFAVLGNHFFGSINEPATDYLGGHVSFSTFANSFLLVYVLST
ncbi:Voltage-dependent T-type calcium channel subunit alpha-1H, partial [Gonapodya sp. JEL0774]